MLESAARLALCSAERCCSFLSQRYRLRLSSGRSLLSARRTLSTASLTSLTAWNLSKVISASVRLWPTPLMNGPLMSMQTSLMWEASPLWASRSSAKAATVLASRPSATNSIAALIDVDEQRDVVVTPSGGCFVDGHALDGRE